MCLHCEVCPRTCVSWPGGVPDGLQGRRPRPSPADNPAASTGPKKLPAWADGVMVHAGRVPARPAELELSRDVGAILDRSGGAGDWVPGHGLAADMKAPAVRGHALCSNH